MSVSSQDDSRQLNCLIEGEPIVFVDTVGLNCTISNLKRRIHMLRAMSTLKDVDPEALQLWKVSAIDKSRCEVTSPTPT
jgi:Crinkler effector protein N-terminal domain